MHIELKDMDISEGQEVVYVLLNDEGYIKIGKTSNLFNRLQSLSGSNSSGHEIVRYYSTEPMYIARLVEKVCHNKFHRYQKNNSEWFYSPNLHYEDVIAYLENVVDSVDFERRNFKR